MPIYRVSSPDDKPIVDVDTIGGVKGVIQSAKPGRYTIDEISLDLLPSGRTSRRWGVGIKRADGTIAFEPDPWDC
jgi:hypothetical protein